LEKGRAEGRAEGFESGLEKGREALLETARKMRGMGLSTEQISAATGLSPEALE
jgi:predicted transposase YdaD